jgi:hypothetical protein
MARVGQDQGRGGIPMLAIVLLAIFGIAFILTYLLFRSVENDIHKRGVEDRRAIGQAFIDKLERDE